MYPANAASIIARPHKKMLVIKKSKVIRFIKTWIQWPGHLICMHVGSACTKENPEGTDLWKKKKESAYDKMIG